jgi:endothelin-converting enzyme
MNTSNNDKTARRTLLNILHKIGKSPLLAKNWSMKDFNLLSSLIYTHQHKINPLFHIGLTIDNKNNNYYRIYFQQSGLSFDETFRYNDRNIRYLFNYFGRKLLKHLDSSLSYYDLSKQIDEIFLFEKRLASIFQLKKSNNPLEFYHIRTYQQIQQWFSSWFDIGNYFERIFQKNKTIFYNETFLISTPKYFEQLNQIIQTTPKHILANYITFQVIQQLLPYMPESFTQIRRPLMSYLQGITEEKQLWEMCVKRTDDAFGFATGRNERRICDFDGDATVEPSDI